MRSLSSKDILAIWEAGQRQHLLDRALTMLSPACPQVSREQLAALSIGQRDAGLLALYEASFGAQLTGLARCPGCAMQVEFGATAAQIRAAVGATPRAQVHEVEAEGVTLRFRSATSLDLAAVVGCADLRAARVALARRCVLQEASDGSLAPELPDGVLAVLAARMAACDPHAEVLVDLDCPGCKHEWQVLLDIVTFFWTELTMQARRLLLEVHALARAYGWGESEILAMSTHRRKHYLEMAGS